MIPLPMVRLRTDDDYGDDNAADYDDKGGIVLLFRSLFWR